MYAVMITARPRAIELPARLEQLREEASLRQLRDPDLDITCGVETSFGRWPCVALRHTLRGAHPRSRTDRGCQLGFDQLLQRRCDDVAQRRRQTRVSASETRREVGQGKLVR
jgi:hypothetical protein